MQKVSVLCSAFWTHFNWLKNEFLVYSDDFICFHVTIWELQFFLTITNNKLLSTLETLLFGNYFALHLLFSFSFCFHFFKWNILLEKSMRQNLDVLLSFFFFLKKFVLFCSLYVAYLLLKASIYRHIVRLYAAVNQLWRLIMVLNEILLSGKSLLLMKNPYNVMIQPLLCF